MKTANGQTDVRRVDAAALKGRFVKARDFYQRTDCGVFKSFKLSSSVFGGRAKRSLGVAYQLARGADAGEHRVRVGKKVVKRLRGGGGQNRTYRYSLKASAVKRGQTVSVPRDGRRRARRSRRRPVREAPVVAGARGSESVAFSSDPRIPDRRAACPA